jgi:dUTPase
MKITQLVILPVMTPAPEIVTELGTTERGDKGFGSTGR